MARDNISFQFPSEAPTASGVPFLLASSDDTDPTMIHIASLTVDVADCVTVGFSVVAGVGAARTIRVGFRESSGTWLWTEWIVQPNDGDQIAFDSIPLALGAEVAAVSAVGEEDEVLIFARVARWES